MPSAQPVNGMATATMVEIISLSSLNLFLGQTPRGRATHPKAGWLLAAGGK